VLGGAMISMGRTLEQLGPKRQFTRVRGRHVLPSSLENAAQSADVPSGTTCYAAPYP
jgi:hypothetical protein